MNTLTVVMKPYSISNADSKLMDNLERISWPDLVLARLAKMEADIAIVSAKQEMTNSHLSKLNGRVGKNEEDIIQIRINDAISKQSWKVSSSWATNLKWVIGAAIGALTVYNTIASKLIH